MGESTHLGESVHGSWRQGPHERACVLHQRKKGIAAPATTGMDSWILLTGLFALL